VSAADLTTFFIMLREGLEAALVVGILLAYLRQVGATRHARLVWGGVGLAIAVSLGALGALGAAGAEFQGRTEMIFEGSTMLLATVVLTWMVFWMMRQARLLKGELHRGVDRALVEGAGLGLFLLAFFAVVREGVETALLLQAAIFAAAGQSTIVGAVVGLAGAIALGLLIYAFGVRIDLRRFFRVTAIVLLLFAAGLIAHAAHEFAGAGFLPLIVDHVWDTSAALPDGTGLGSFLRALLGYSASPSLLEVVVYVGYLALVAILARTGVGTALTPAVRPEKTTA
jgi:high-affinity iron transporter